MLLCTYILMIQIQSQLFEHVYHTLSNRHQGVRRYVELRT